MKKIFSKWFRDNKIDILVWGIFLFYEIVIVGLISKRFGHPLTYLLHYAINISIFYLHALLLLPWSCKKESQIIWKVPIVFLAEVSIYTIIAYIIDFILIEINIITHVTEIKFTYEFILTAIYRGMYFLGFATGYYFIAEHFKARKKAAEGEKQSLIKQHEIEKALVKAQNAYLKTQISPHFLFNTLDFIYYNIEFNTHKASECILLLSRIMHYAVKADKDKNFIFLEDEIEQVENLLYLHQLKKENEIPIQLICDEDVRKVKFIPLVLLTLVENILKHGDLTDKMHEATIKVVIKNGWLCIETNNLINHKEESDKNHLGLTNIQQRLMLTYGSNFRFEHIIDTNNHFIINISISPEALNVHETPLNNVKENDKEVFRAAAGQM